MQGWVFQQYFPHLNIILLWQKKPSLDFDKWRNCRVCYQLLKKEMKIPYFCKECNVALHVLCFEKVQMNIILSLAFFWNSFYLQINKKNTSKTPTPPPPTGKYRSFDEGGGGMIGAPVFLGGGGEGGVLDFNQETSYSYFGAAI